MKFVRAPERGELFHCSRTKKL